MTLNVTDLFGMLPKPPKPAEPIHGLPSSFIAAEPGVIQAQLFAPWHTPYFKPTAGPCTGPGSGGTKRPFKPSP
jgi:hypothetical protein